MANDFDFCMEADGGGMEGDGNVRSKQGIRCEGAGAKLWSAVEVEVEWTIAIPKQPKQAM